MYEPFGPRFYEWWAGLNPALRYGVGAVVLLTSAVAWWLQVGDFWFWGPLAVVGIILILVAGGLD
jgi:hypothetical protein